MDIREIAKRARVSTATVSRTINRVPTVDPQLAKRVWKVVDELGYYPNTQARALVSGKSRLFGLVVSEITNPFFPEIVHTFEELAVQNGYEILLTSTGHDAMRMKTAVRRLIEQRVDGVAVFTFGMEESLLENFRLRNLPLVFVELGHNAPHVSNIQIDYQHGVRQAVQHLAALRHTHIGFVSGPLYLPSALARKQAFVDSMSEIGLTVDPGIVVEEDHTMQGGIRAMQRLSIQRPRPTAIMCSNDMTAIGIMREAYDVGIAVPGDLSVVGFDNIRISEFMIPPLTTVEMSQAELARIAFKALVDQIARDDPKEKGFEYRLKTNLVLRRSTALAQPSRD